MMNDQLKSFFERIHNMEQEIKAAQEDRKQIYLEAKSMGYDPAIMKKVYKIWQDEACAKEELALIETYAREIGVQLGLDL